MPSILEQIERKRSYDEESELAKAQANANWSSTFSSTPSSEVLRDRANVDDLISRAVQRKQEMQAASNLQDGLAYARMKEVEARTRHAADMAPENVRHRQAQVESELTRERVATRVDAFKERMAEREAIDTDRFIAGMEEGVKKFGFGTPELAARAALLRLESPAMKSDFFDDVFKTLAPGKDPEQEIALAVEKKRQLKALDLTPEQIRANKVADKKALMEVVPPPKPPGPADLGTETITTKKDGKTTRITRPVAPIPVSASSPTPAIKEVVAPTATTAAPVARKIFKDANGRRAYQNPDGTFEEIL